MKKQLCALLFFYANIGAMDFAAGASLYAQGDTTMSSDEEQDAQAQVCEIIRSSERGDFWVQLGLAEIFTHPRMLHLFLEDIENLMSEPLPSPKIDIANPRAYIQSRWQKTNNLETVPEQDLAWWYTVQILTCCQHAQMWLQIGVADALGSLEFLQAFVDDMAKLQYETVLLPDHDAHMDSIESVAHDRMHGVRELAEILGRLSVCT